MNPRKRLGEMLLEAGVIDETQLKAALGHQRQWGVRIGQALVDLKLATEHDIVGALARKCGFDVAHLDAVDPGALGEALKLLPREFAQRNNVLPTAVDAGTITVAMSDPSNLAIVDEIRFRTGRKVKVCIGGDREIADAVARCYPGDAPVEAIALDLEGDDSSAEAFHDPFGGGSKDALEAFFASSGENAGADPAFVLSPFGDAPAAPAAQSQPPPAPVATASAPAAPRSPTPAAPPAARAAAAPAAKPPAAQRMPQPPAPPAAPAKGPPAAAPSGSKAGDVPLGGCAQPGDAKGRDRRLTPSEQSILDALKRLAGGSHAEPEIVRPMQAMAAMIRLLLRKRVVTEQEFLDELSKK